MGSYRLQALDELQRIDETPKKKKGITSLFERRPLAKLVQAKRASGQPPWRILHYDHIVYPEKASIPLPRYSYVKPSTFERHLSYLKKNTNVISLGELVDSIQSGKLIEPNTIVLSIEGGYQTQYENAFRLLKKARLPATLSLHTAYVGTEHRRWDQLYLCAMLMLKSRNFYFIPPPVLGEDLDQEVERLAPDGQITDAVTWIVFRRLLEVDDQTRVVALMVLEEITNRTGGLGRQQVYMSWEQVREIAESSIQVISGSHHYHPYPRLSTEQIREDIKHSLTTLQEEQIDVLPLIFMPDSDTSTESVTALRELGFSFCLSVGDHSIKNGIMGCVPIYEEVSSNTRDFENQIWNLKD